MNDILNWSAQTSWSLFLPIICSWNWSIWYSGILKSISYSTAIYWARECFILRNSLNVFGFSELVIVCFNFKLQMQFINKYVHFENHVLISYCKRFMAEWLALILDVSNDDFDSLLRASLSSVLTDKHRNSTVTF
jgi:hypothetical protein